MVIKKLKKLNAKHFDRFNKWMGGFFDNPRDFLRVVLPQGDNIQHHFIADYNNMDKPVQLGQVAKIKGNLGEFMSDLCLNNVERELRERYNLNSCQVLEYKNEANEIIDWGDRDILIRLDIPADNPGKCIDYYKRVLYYVVERCVHEKEIRADFFKEVIS